MASRLDTDHDRPFRTATAYTYTVRVDADGRSEPIPPGPEEEQWMKLETERDDTGEGVDWTKWARIVRDWWGASSLGGVGGAIAKVLHIRPAGKLED
jgi:hypothetical protein